MTIVPVTWEAEARESLETQKAEVAVSRDHAAALKPGDRLRLHLKKKRKKMTSRIFDMFATFL